MSIINYHFKERSQYPSRRACCGRPCAVRQPPPILLGEVLYTAEGLAVVFKSSLEERLAELCILTCRIAHFDVSSLFTRRVGFLILLTSLRFSERKAESGFELSRAEAGSQYSLRVKLLQRNGPCFDAERLLVSNCTAKVQHS